MKRFLADDRGFAVITAILLLTVMLGLGLGMLAYSDAQSHAARDERTRESSFNLGEATLNGQVYALTQPGAWPSASPGVPTCTPASTSTLCPNATSLGTGYAGSASTPDYNAATGCPPGTPTAAWTSTVHDDNNGTSQNYDPAVVPSNPTWDSDGDGKVWVRTTSVAQCKVQTAVALVARNVRTLPFPWATLSANWFQTANQGKKVIIDTVGKSAKAPGAQAVRPADVIVRCYQQSHTPCADYQTNRGQVSPPVVTQQNNPSTGPAPPPTLTTAQLNDLADQARAVSRYYPTGTCPTTAAQLTSVATPSGMAPVFVEGPCNLSLGGNVAVNSAASPGFLVIKAGTLTLSGAASYYGLVYAANLGSPAVTGAAVSINGNASIQGAVTVDGPGGVYAGSSKTNLIFDQRAFDFVKNYNGAAIVRGTWRVLPANTQGS
jgi:Tfp pilus assembly protein PilX